MPRPNPKPGRRSIRARRGPAVDFARLAAFAERLATDVGRWLARQRRGGSALACTRKAEGDPVTAFDVEAERRIARAVRRAWPDHGFLGEETEPFGLDRELVWVVDPVDGTANFAAGLLPWGVSIACLRAGRPVAAAVHCRPHACTFAAVAGGGTRVDGEVIRMPVRPRLGPDSIVGVQWSRGAHRVPFLDRMLGTGTRVRVQGSTVCQMCDVARGALDANVQSQGRVWDIAAAGLVVLEAGGEFTDWRGRPLFPLPQLAPGDHHPSIAAGAPIAGEAARLLAGAAPV